MFTPPLRPSFACLPAFAVILLSGNCPCVSAAEIFEHPAVLAQPFDKAPFHAVQVPEWVQNTLGAGYTLSGMDTAQRERAAAAGVTLSEMGFVDPFFTYYPSKLLQRRSPHVPPERLEKDLAEYRKFGVRVLGVYPPCLQSEVYEKHPDWRRIATDTREIPQVDLVKQPAGGMLCLLGPYGDFFIDVLAEIATQYPDVAAFSFDGLHYGGSCYCQHCREDFLAETKNEIPPVNMDDPAFRRYQHWADRRMENLIQRMQKRLKGIRPEISLVTWTTNSGRFGHLLDIPRNMPARMNLLLDAPDQEFWLDESNRGATIVPAFANAYAWAVTNHRTAFSEPYLMSHGNPYGKDSFPAHEIGRRMMLALTHGTAPSLAVAQPPHLQGEVYRLLGEVKKCGPWLTHKQPEPWAAIVMSDNTRVFYGRSSGTVEERYLANVFGFFRAALEEHLPFTLINDWNLTPAELAKYKVLVLPNTACLDDAQCAAIRGFVEAGGGLVASMDASWCDAFGDPRSDFALADVLGVNRLGTPSEAAPPGDLDVNFARTLGAAYWEKRKGVWDFLPVAGSPEDTPRLKGMIGEQPVTFKGPAVKVALREATLSSGGLTPKPGGAGESLPAIATHPFGKGRVVYLGAGIDAAYYLYSYPYQRILLQQAIEWAASAPAPISVKAPMCVHAVTMRQLRDGERLIIHLYNDLNTTAFHAKPDEDVPLREEVVPIHDIRITLRGYNIQKAHLEPEGRGVEVKTTPEGSEILVPRLDVHTMVVVEIK